MKATCLSLLRSSSSTLLKVFADEESIHRRHDFIVKNCQNFIPFTGETFARICRRGSAEFTLDLKGYFKGFDFFINLRSLHWWLFNQHIPRKFLKEPLLSYQSKEKIVLLNEKGESQLVNIISTRSDRMFSAGWSSFARNNNLKVRDTCMFELVDKFEMQVHIIRREKLKSNACKKDAADFAKCSQPADNIAKEGKKRAREKAATSSLKLLGDSGKRMKGNWETVEQHAAKSVPTKRPFFVSRIQKYNFRSGVLYVPRKFLKEHRLSYKSKEKMVLRNQKGECQSVNIISYRGDCYFCAGWRAFARNSKIRERNLCMFELVNKFEMHVRIIRHEKLKSNK